MEATLADRDVTLGDRLDLIRGAVDAHLHPPRRSVVPGLLAVSGGAAWSIVAAAIAVQPVPPDWPGYLIEVIPLAVVAVVLLLGAIVGSWLRVGDGGGRFGTLALDIAVAGHLAWVGALIGIFASVEYGASTAIASWTALGGTSLVGLSLIRRDDWPIGGLVALTPVTFALGTGWPWVLFGLGWSVIGLLELREVSRDGPVPLAT
jgi:hypothetical protein